MNVDNLTTEECMVMPEAEPAYNVTFSYDCSGDVQILPDSSDVNPSDVPPVSQPTVQEVSVPDPPEIAAPSTYIYIAEPLIKDVPAEQPCVQEESVPDPPEVIPSAIVSTDIVAQAVKFADILFEEEFVPDYKELSDDLQKQDIETQTEDDLVARISLLEDQLKKERGQHKEETRKLGEFVERLQKGLDDKDEEIQNLNSMIVTLDEYENLPKYGTRSSYALDGFDDLWSSTDSQTRALQEKFNDNNNMTDDKPTEKRTPDRDSPSPQNKKLKSVVLIVPRTNEEVWKGFARKVNGIYKGDELPCRGFRF
jgi:hypothetical protein